MATESKNKLSKSEKKRLFITRLICGILALLMMGGVAYYTLIFLLP